MLLLTNVLATRFSNLFDQRVIEGFSVITRIRLVFHAVHECFMSKNILSVYGAFLVLDKVNPEKLEIAVAGEFKFFLNSIGALETPRRT